MTESESESESFELDQAPVRPASRIWRHNASLVTVRADTTGVVLGDRTIARADIEDARVIPRPGGASVRLGVRRGTDVEIDLPDIPTARELLRALRLDPAHASASFKIASSMFSGGIYLALIPLMLVGIVATTAYVGRRLGLAALPVGFAGIAGLLGFLFSNATLKIGAEGILVSWMHRRRFIPYGDVDQVWIHEQPVGRGGVTSFVKLTGPRGEVDIPGGSREFAETIAERIRDARRRSAGSEGAPGGALDRAGRDARAWIDHLKRVGTGAAADARRAAVPIERLLDVLDDPQQPPRMRIAAAIAASGSGDADARTRILEVASTAASPKFRVALEAAADPERDAELEQLVAEEEEEEAAKARMSASA